MQLSRPGLANEANGKELGARTNPCLYQDHTALISLSQMQIHFNYIYHSSFLSMER